MRKETGSKEVNIYKLLQKFSMDTIWNYAFGLDIDIQRNESEYYPRSEGVFRNAETLNIFSFICNIYKPMVN